jgi:hypothetical protein
MEDLIILEVLLCVAVLVAFVVHPWTRRVDSVGLPLCYILALGMIHWLGGLIHALPVVWRSAPDPFTPVGFQQAFWATLAFAGGSLLVAPFILKFFMRGESVSTLSEPKPEQVRLPKIYLVLGIVFFGVLAPSLANIPTISAISVCGIYLAVVGVCLACWSAYLQRKPSALFGWVLAICVLPFVTILTLGFVGYGAVAALLVFTFVASFYRPRWHAAVGLIVLIVLGLSLFITYFRDRSALRDKVWGGAAYMDRFDTLVDTLSNFEVIDLENPRHLQSIDARLNQNYLVGRVVRTIELGQEQFANGGTISEALLALVPRILWPDKPVEAGSGNTVSRYARMKFAQGTSIGIGQVMEFYINFGTLGVFLGFTVMGVIVRVVDTMAAIRLKEGDWEGFMSWFVPSISLVNVGGSLVEVVGTAGASVALVFVVNRILSSWRIARPIRKSPVSAVSIS